MALRKKKSVYRQTFVSVIVAVILLCGVWALIGVVAPEPLSDATSSTIYYEDLADDYMTRVKVNEELLDEYIRRNYANHNLTRTAKTEKEEKAELAKYQEEGAKNAEVAALLEKHFTSIDKDGYASYEGPWIDFANGKRLTIPTLVHLILDEREYNDCPYPLYDAKTGKIVEEGVYWSVLDMLGKPMDFEIAPLKDLAGTIKLLSPIDPDRDPTDLENNVEAGDLLTPLFNGVTLAILDPDVVGSPIYIMLSTGTDASGNPIYTGGLQLIPSNESRGVLDYQSQAWLDSNGLVYLLCAVFAVRKWCLIWSGIMVVTLILIGLLRKDNTVAGKKQQQNNGGTRNRKFTSPAQDTLNRIVPNPEGSYFVINTKEEVDYAQMSLQLLRDRENNVARRYDIRK